MVDVKLLTKVKAHIHLCVAYSTNIPGLPDQKLE